METLLLLTKLYQAHKGPFRVKLLLRKRQNIRIEFRLYSTYELCINEMLCIQIFLQTKSIKPFIPKKYNTIKRKVDINIIVYIVIVEHIKIAKKKC